jgi:replicative DNA helicase
MFTEENLRRIVGFMKDRYSLNETVATYKDLDTLIRSKISDTIGVERCLAMLEKIKTVDTRGIDIIEGYSERFFKQQNLTKALNKAFEIIKLGDSDRYDDIEDIVKKALECNNKKEMGFHIFDNMEDALKEDYRCTIPTGADMLDEAFYGGLGKGELGIIIAPSSVGKTSATTGFAATAAVTKTEDNNYKGYKVLHIFFEDEEVNIVKTEGIIDIPYEVVNAVGDVILVDQEKLVQYQSSQQKRINNNVPKRPMVKRPSN